jgi:hypothetical protein
MQTPTGAAHAAPTVFVEQTETGAVAFLDLGVGADLVLLSAADLERLQSQVAAAAVRCA